MVTRSRTKSRNACRKDSIEISASTAVEPARKDLSVPKVLAELNENVTTFVPGRASLGVNPTAKLEVKKYPAASSPSPLLIHPKFQKKVLELPEADHLSGKKSILRSTSSSAFK